MYQFDSCKVIENDFPVRDITDSGIDYVLRCTKGPYRGMFVYINATDNGEIIGNAPECTLRIADCGLENKHAQIKLELDEDLNRYNYQLRSYHQTWIKVRYDVPTFMRNNMELKIGKLNYSVRIHTSQFSETQEWLNLNDLNQLKHVLEQHNITNLKQIKSLKQDQYTKYLQQSNIPENLIARFGECHQQLATFIDQDNFRIHLVNQHNHEILAIGWAGATISSKTRFYQKPPELLIKKLDFEDLDECTEFELTFRFLYGRYMLYSSKPDNYNVFVRAEEKQTLLIDDVIRIKGIELTLQRYNAGHYADIGTRRVMEDGYAILQDIQVSRLPVSCFAILDGHNGDQCVKYVSFNLLDNLRELLNNEDFDEQPRFIEFIMAQLKKAFKTTDANFYRDYCEDQAIQSGCVCVLVLIVGDYLISANCGDCRAVLSRNGQAILLSRDHKPESEEEKKRIEKRGGTVQVSRIGALAVSRAFGDFNLKKQRSPLKKNLMTVTPFITVNKINYSEDEFIVLFSDGIIDGFQNNQNVVNFISNYYLGCNIGEQDPQRAARMVVLKAFETSISVKNGSDNMSCIVVNLTRGIHQ